MFFLHVIVTHFPAQTAALQDESPACRPGSSHECSSGNLSFTYAYTLRLSSGSPSVKTQLATKKRSPIFSFYSLSNIENLTNPIYDFFAARPRCDVISQLVFFTGTDSTAVAPRISRIPTAICIVIISPKTEMPTKTPVTGSNVLKSEALTSPQSITPRWNSGNAITVENKPRQKSAPHACHGKFHWKFPVIMAARASSIAASRQIQKVSTKTDSLSKVLLLSITIYAA